MNVRWRLPSAWLLILSGVGGCGRIAGSGAEPMNAGSLAPGLAGRRCAMVMRPTEIPSFDGITRAGTRSSVALWGSLAEPDDTIELSVRYDDHGRLAWVQPLRSNMASDRATELTRLIRSAMDEQGPEEWGVRLRFAGGAVDGVFPSVVCRARRSPVAGRLPPAPLGTEREMAELYASLGRALTARVLLDAEGRVMDVKLRHTSGSRLLDQWVLDLARATHYEPKLHDGLGVASAVELRVAFRRSVSSIGVVIRELEGGGA